MFPGCGAHAHPGRTGEGRNPGGRDLRTTLDYRDFAFVKDLRRYGVSPCTCSAGFCAATTLAHRGQNVSTTSRSGVASSFRP